VVPEVANESKDKLPDITVEVDQHGNYYFNGTQVSDRALLVVLTNRFKASSIRKLAIHADRRVVYDRVANVIDIAKSAGAKDFLLVNRQRINP
jgi:biopolymer transport protein ExbD